MAEMAIKILNQLLYFFIEVWLIYNVVPMSAIQHSDSDLYMYTFFLFFLILFYF